MTSKEQVEEQWLRAVIVPKIVESGKLFDDDSLTNDFKLISIDIKFIGDDEAFMLTTCYKAKLEFELNGGVHGTRTLMVKRTPQVPEEIFNSINFPALFTNEICGYTMIMPAISNFSKQIINIPKYFYGDLQRCSATIVLEDFNSNGWQMSKELVNLPLQHTILAVKYLGTFHGICFAMKHMQNDQFQELVGNIKESRYATEEAHPEWDHTLKVGVNRAIKSAQRYQPKIPMEFLQKLQHLIYDYYHYGKQRMQPIEPMATLCHGDFLRNNVAYKYDESTDLPIDIMMFDLQTLRYSSPMVDLSVFLALSTFKDVRVKHFDEIFRTYCEELSSTYMQHTRKSVPDYLSRDNLLKEYVLYLPYSISVTTSFLMTLVEPKKMSTEDMLCMERTLDEIEEDCMQRGGEIVDRELAHQIKEIYDLSSSLKVDISEGIELK